MRPGNLKDSENDNFKGEESFAIFNPVSDSVKHRILQLLQDVSQFNTNDILVGIDHGIVVEMDGDFGINGGPVVVSRDLSLQGELKSIITTAQKTEKEKGVFPLCLTRGIIEWEFKQSSVRTPLWLVPCKVEIKKITNTVSIFLEEEEAFVNPFVVSRLEKEFNLQLPETFGSLVELLDFLEEKGFSPIHSEPSFIGNFHHHRFEIIKELQELSELPPSPALCNLLGDESAKNSISLPLSTKFLFPADTDQLQVFKQIEQVHTVVQGPPGTGKSQVLSNLLAKILVDHRSAVVVSEKRVALEVLKKKLNQFDLGHLCFIATSETLSKDVLHELKENWNRLEQYSGGHESNLQLSEQYLDQLQLQLDLLNRDSLVGGISYTQYKRLASPYDLENIAFVSDLPDLSTWLKERTLVEQLFENGIAFYVSAFSYGTLLQEGFKQLDKSIRNWIVEVQRLKHIFALETYGELQNAMKKAALCQHYSTASFRKYEAILTPDSKEQKKFLKLRKKYLQLQLIQHTCEAERSNWKYAPSLTETETLLSLLKDTSYLNRWRFKKQWNKVAKIPDLHAESALHKWKQYLVNSHSISQIEVELCEIGVDDVKSDLEFIYQQLHHFTAQTKADWQLIPTSDRPLYAEENKALNTLYSQFKTHFRWEEHTKIELFLVEVLELFSDLVHFHNDIRSLSEQTIRNLKNYTSFAKMEAAVCKSNYTKLTANFPQFVTFNASHLHEKCRLIIDEQDTEAHRFSCEILDKQNERFKEYTQLLQTPSSKLTAAEKEFKAILKKGKSILVKEFAKTRNFPSLRELFASEAHVWIKLLKPIWLSNPTQIAKCFPMEEQLFDVAIFDEASQIPLQNALGTIHRTKRILVAGDQQQMGPSSYFKTQSEEVVDLLHQASFYWKNISLKHHYRSENPELIRFSNKHFYGNELIAFPSANTEKQAIAFHYCENGIFDDRKNIPEAKCIAELIKKKIDSKEHLGIVAFSETQLAEIYSQLSTSVKEKLENRLDDDTAFFKALENVQGEECDHLLISLGYGKNDAGEFHMRFGPLNAKNGPKRLNVLLTRAKKKIDFFASVKGSDFKISSNEAVDLLRLYLLQIESGCNPKEPSYFPYGLSPKIQSESIGFENIYNSIHSATELVTLVRVLEYRNWKIEFN